MEYNEFRIAVPPEFRENVISVLAGKGALGFIEDEAGVIAYFPETYDAREITAELCSLKSVLAASDPDNYLRFSHAILPDQDWTESWKKNFAPLNVGKRFTILPPWEKKQPGRINLVIDPGMAFGTGHHETTRSCLVLMEKYEGATAKDRFLDAGTGTGLLAIAASKLGWREVTAVDTDPLATAAAGMNIGLNDAGNVDIREGSIDAASGTYGCIIANIISGVLIQLAPGFVSLLNPGGILILSGILAEQADEVAEEMKKSGLALRETLPDGKWLSLVMKRPD